MAPDPLSADVIGSKAHLDEIRELIEGKIGKKVELDVRQMEGGQRFEDQYVDIEGLINMDITIEDE